MPPSGASEPWREAAVQEAVAGAVFSRIYEVRATGGTFLRAVVWRDSFELPIFVTVSAPGRLLTPVRARLGFRTDGDPVSPADMRLACIVLQRGEEVGASFPALCCAYVFLRGLWVMA